MFVTNLKKTIFWINSVKKNIKIFLICLKYWETVFDLVCHYDSIRQSYVNPFLVISWTGSQNNFVRSLTEFIPISCFLMFKFTCYAYTIEAHWCTVLVSIRFCVNQIVLLQRSLIFIIDSLCVCVWCVYTIKCFVIATCMSAM